MRIQSMMVLVAAGGLIGFLQAADTLEGETQSPCVYALDTNGSAYEVKTPSDLGALWPATCRAGGKVTYTCPDGSQGTLIENVQTATSAALPINAGGLWTFVNSLEGSATFTVRHSLYGTLGEGTEASPAKIVDGAELVDYAAGDGYVFTLNGRASLQGDLAVPAGICLVNAGDGKMRLVSSADGCVYRWAEIVYPVDCELEGPDRTTVRKTPMPVAYSGDDWAGDVRAASTLTFVSPNGTSTTLNNKGTGAVRAFRFSVSGLWTLRLTMADGTTREAKITVLKTGFTLLVL